MILLLIICIKTITGKENNYIIIDITDLIRKEKVHFLLLFSFRERISYFYLILSLVQYSESIEYKKENTEQHRIIDILLVECN